MKVKTKQGRQEVTLDKRYFIAKGGEGEIYAKNGVVYKVCDAGKMIPEPKLLELAVLNEPHIVRPEDVLLDTSGTPVGYTLKFIDNCYTLCQLFTKAFRLRNNVGPDTILKLVQQMQKTIDFIHKHNILLVDLNELNFLVTDDFRDVYFIDVNSYQTPNYPATAIMDSIRDRHCNNKFSEGTDWFSFAIVSFQMMIGIHPYKGKHPSYTDLKTALDCRMKDNISVLHKDVSYPQAACQPLTVIPQVYMDWYRAIFEDGKRVAPPVDLVTAIKIVQAIKTVVGSRMFDMNKLHEFLDPITIYYYHQSQEAALCGNNLIVNRHSYPLASMFVKNVAFTPKQNLPIAAWMEGGQVKLWEVVNKKPIPFVCNASNLMDYDGRVYIQNGMNILEVIFTEMGSNVLASPHVVGTCMENNAVFYDGVVVQNLFDAYYASIFPQTKQCRQYALRELDGYKIVDARYESRVLMVVGVNKKGEYDRFIFRFAKDWNGYDLRKVEDITFTGLNFTVLSNGICVSLTEEENVEIFKAEKDGGGAKQYNDPAIKGDMELSHQGNQTVFTRGKEVYTISVRKTI